MPKKETLPIYPKLQVHVSTSDVQLTEIYFILIYKMKKQCSKH